MKNPVVLVLFFLGLVGILVATKQIQAPKIFLPKASVIGVSLSILPSILTIDPGTEKTLDIVLNPDDESVSAIELVLNYDSSIIQVTDIKPTAELPQSLALDTSKPGKTSIILLVNPSSTKSPTGIIGKVTIKAIKAGTTSLKFDQSTKVSATGKTGDVTGAVESAEITVAGNEQIPVVATQPQKTDTSQADDLINRYLNSDSQLAEASKSGGLIKNLSSEISKYIKNSVEQVNKNIENQARRFLD